ncbi:MAG: NTP transferase domain-containing protein [Gemmatimonadota bacterium]
MRLTLVVLAAGRARRFGRLKQLEPVGPSGEPLFEYAVHDALRAGCERVLFVTRPDLEARLRAHVEGRFGSSIAVTYVTQALDDLPRGFRPPPGRRAPWGTGHAVLAVREHVREPFLACNADDFYGPTSIGRLARRLQDALTTGDPSHFLVGYPLRHTSFSEAGGVNRAICRCDASLFLEEIEEVRAIRRNGSVITGVGEDGAPCVLTGEELSSMNLWGFQPALFGPLWHAFGRFHASTGDPVEGEFPLSTAMGALIAGGRVRVRVVPAEDRGHAMTYAEDRKAVASAVAESVAAGDYPTDLAAWFRRRRGSAPG